MENYQNRLKKENWRIIDIPTALGKRLIRKYHYAKGTSNTYVYLHGLLDIKWECKGVAWWIPPTKSAAFATYPKNT